MKFTRTLLLLCLLCLIHGIGNAQNFRKYFVDTTDKALDVSGFLNSPAGFMPVPVVITEPALGMGGGLAAIYFHSKANFIDNHGPGKLPPVMTVGAVAGTINGTWIAAIGHQGSYKKDRFRYTGGLGYMNINISFYGAGIIQEERAYDFSIKGIVFFQEFSVRPMRKVPLFTGLNYTFTQNNVTFKTGLNIPGLDELSKETNMGGLNLLLMYDTRNNMFTPGSGLFTAFELGRFSQYMGGDTDFSNFANRTYFYLPITKEKLVAGFRLTANAKWGDVPFYALPFIQQRGIPAMRYQDHFAGMGETELRWNVYHRWSLIGFAGVGYTAPKLNEFDFSQGKAAIGGGFRYFIAKEYGVHGGLDIAKGPEDWAWYITFGSNWAR